MAELRLQNFIIARLADFCDYRRPLDPERIPDPVSFLWAKLGEIDGPLKTLKQQLLDDAIAQFFKSLAMGRIQEAQLADFKQLLESYLPLGDYVDAAFSLELDSLGDPERRLAAETMLRGMKVLALLEEDLKPPPKQNRNWLKLVAEIYSRLEFELLEKVLAHKPLDARRLGFILRRCRFRSADFCAVFRFPTHADDTFTPFILPRVEAFVGANRRLLQRIRIGDGAAG